MPSRGARAKNWKVRRVYRTSEPLAAISGTFSLRGYGALAACASAARTRNGSIAMKILWDAANPFMSAPCCSSTSCPVWCLFSTGDALWLLQGYGCSREPETTSTRSSSRRRLLRLYSQRGTQLCHPAFQPTDQPNTPAKCQEPPSDPPTPSSSPRISHAAAA